MRTIALFFALCLGMLGTQAQDATLKIMSYNLRFAGKTPPNSWPERRPLMAKLLQAEAPDLIGTQEGLGPQLRDIATDLPGYAWLGAGRDDGADKGEFMAIFYRKDRLQPLSTNHFWLSDTPETPGSTTWGNSIKRMVTYVKFKDLRTHKEFWHWNTHFDHLVQPAREKSAELIKARVAGLKTDLPVIVTGDFNALNSNKAYQILTAEGFFADTWELAKERVGAEYATFNGFKELQKTAKRIDWILLRGSATVSKTQIITFSENGQFPSDHNPLVIWITLK